LQTNLALNNPVLRDLSCLNPASRKNDNARSAISQLYRLLIKVTKTDAFTDSAPSEWLIYMCDTDQVLEEWTEKHSPTHEYWHYISKMSDASGAKKYPNLVNVSKSAHSNAVPQRGFSVNNALLALTYRSMFC
jgi:hypothetical protein